MSIELALIPIAIAVAGAWQARPTNGGGPGLSAPTRFKHEQLLQDALGQLGCAARPEDGRVETHSDGRHIRFERGRDGVFVAEFYGGIDPDAARAFLTDLDDAYTQVLQQRVYQNLLTRAEQRGMQLESERVEADQSILLTFNVQGAR